MTGDFQLACLCQAHVPVAHGENTQPPLIKGFSAQTDSPHAPSGANQQARVTQAALLADVLPELQTQLPARQCLEQSYDGTTIMTLH